jgi:hypothetical protein
MQMASVGDDDITFEDLGSANFDRMFEHLALHLTMRSMR